PIARKHPTKVIVNVEVREVTKRLAEGVHAAQRSNDPYSSRWFGNRGISCGRDGHIHSRRPFYLRRRGDPGGGRKIAQKSGNASKARLHERGKLFKRTCRRPNSLRL